ncbi:hypothetical protein RRG08_045819 [Elysia crispata]|uniref:Uncharacterized protein n=1 Tax=Elysia crispata TaxID=231223 RepID=A0AAE0YYH1_9GAST|nr:hypothetical protein RRG08_045819 [Elysia crispata]
MLHNQIDRRNSIEGSAFDTTRLSYCDAAFLVFWCRTPDTIIQTVVCETRLDLGSKRASPVKQLDRRRIQPNLSSLQTTNLIYHP